MIEKKMPESISNFLIEVIRNNNLILFLGITLILRQIL